MAKGRGRVVNSLADGLLGGAAINPAVMYTKKKIIF